jgi:hypothetical protein
MPPLKVMLIRHAEKPADKEGKEPPFGVDAEGRPDPLSLTPLGWQRAGALAPWFARSVGRHLAISAPKCLFAAHPRGTSYRTGQTLEPLSQLCSLPIRSENPVGEEEKLVPEVLACRGPVLIAWEYKALPRLARLLGGETLRCPEQWPADRFDLAWVLDRDAVGAWHFTQVAQMLLAGDSHEVLPVGG